MNTELQGKLVEILTSIQAATGKASDFALAELPDVVQSYILYGRVWETSAAVLSVLLMVVFFVAGWRIDRHLHRLDDCYPQGLVVVFAGLAAIIPACMAFSYTRSAVLVWLAPKVWLLQELARLVK